MVQHNKKSKKKKKGKVFKTILIVLLFLFLISGIALAGITLAIIKTAPDLDVNSILSLNQQSVIYSNSEEFIDDVITREKRYIIPIKDMPKDLQNAFISIEDERFPTHNGIDFKRILGAVYIDVKNVIAKKSGLHGASTITQQLLKNTLLTPEVSVKRKVQEMYLAMQLEKKLTKDQILEAYMNTIFLGGNSYGVEAASYQYFGVSVKNLSLIQCAFLAGAPQSPSSYYQYSVISKKNPSIYLNRTKTVLSKMLENGYVDQAKYDKAIADVDKGELKFTPQKTNNKYNYEWFSRLVVDKVMEDLKKQYKYSDSEVARLVMNGGLKIYTTMDKKVQDNAQDVLNNASKYINIKEYVDKDGVIQPQMSAVVMDYRTGQVKAIIGGRGNQKPYSYNRAASNNFLRSTGSAIKPLTVYGPAIDLKLATAGTVIEDSPLSADISKKYNGYNPKNETNDFKGYVTLREALMKSINLVSVKLEDQIGIKNGIAYGEKFGLKFNKNSKTSIATLALGQFNNDPKDLDGSNPLYMAAAYGTFGNNGMYTDPILYTKVVDRTGKVILENKVTQKKILSPQSAYIMYDLLKGPVIGYSAAPAKFGDMPVVGKTGTTNDNQDFWFSGLTPYLSCAIWVGNDLPSEVKGRNGERLGSGMTVTPLWSKIMAKAHEGLAVKDIPMPQGMQKVAICMDSGKVATDLCAKDPRGSRVREEMFIDGTAPTALCDAHVELKVNKLNGKIATQNTPSELIETRVFIRREYSPSVNLADQKYVAPKDLDDTVPVQKPDIKPPVDDKNPGGNKDPEDDKDLENPEKPGNGTTGRR